MATNKIIKMVYKGVAITVTPYMTQNDIINLWEAKYNGP